VLVVTGSRSYDLEPTADVTNALEPSVQQVLGALGLGS
jgi:hypothetical protein